MKKALCLIAISMLLCRCAYETNNECLGALNIKIGNALNDKTELDFKAELNCFEWDSLMLIDRHFDAGDVTSKTGVNLRRYRLMGLKYLIKQI